MTSTYDSVVHRLIRFLVAAVAALGVLILPPADGVHAQDEGDPLAVGYLLDRGRVRTIAFPDALDTLPIGINDRGEIVGTIIDADERAHGFLRDRKGRYHRIDVPDAVATEAHKLNDRGQIAGTFNTENCQIPAEVLCPGAKGFVLDRGRFTTIHKSGAVYTQAMSINNAGVVVGEFLDEDGNFHGFRWQRGRFDIIEAPGSLSTSVTDINDQGDLVGVLGDPASGVDGFLLRDRSGAEFESFDTPAGRTTLVWGLNNRRHIVGFGGELDLSVVQGFLLSGGPTGEFTPIEIRGTDRTIVLDINDRGQMVAKIVPPTDDETATRDGQPALPIMAPGGLPERTRQRRSKR